MSHEGKSPYRRRHLVGDQIRQMALAKAPGERLPTTKEFAEQLQTSTKTIEAVLRELEQADVIVRRRGSGLFVSERLFQKKVAVLLAEQFFGEWNFSPFWGLLWERLLNASHQRAEREGLRFEFRLVRRSEEDRLRIETQEMPEWRSVDAALSLGVGTHITDWIYNPGRIPVIGFAAPGHVLIGIDEIALVSEAVEALARRGCRRIALWHPGEYFLGNEAAPVLRAAFGEAAARCGLAEMPPEEGRPSGAAPKTPWAADHGRAVAERVFGRPRSEWPDGLVIGDDMMTVGAIPSLCRLGVWPGRDVQIATHANLGSPALYGWEEEMFRLAVDPNEIAEAMIAEASALLRDWSPARLYPPRPLLIRPHLREPGQA